MDDNGIDSWYEMFKDKARRWNISIRRLIQLYNITILFNTSASGSRFYPLPTRVGDDLSPKVSRIDKFAMPTNTSTF